jgi:hypothetical protein
MEFDLLRYYYGALSVSFDSLSRISRGDSCGLFTLLNPLLLLQTFGDLCLLGDDFYWIDTINDLGKLI